MHDKKWIFKDRNEKYVNRISKRICTKTNKNIEELRIQITDALQIHSNISIKITCLGFSFSYQCP